MQPAPDSLPARVRRRLARGAAERRRRMTRSWRLARGKGVAVVPEPGRPTNIGRVFDELVERARRNQQAVGLDPAYDAVRESFDHVTYLLLHRELQSQPHVDLIEHFLAHEGRYPQGSDERTAAEAIAPVLGLAPDTLTARLTDVRTDLTERIRYGALGRQIARAAALEPLLGSAWAATARLQIPPFDNTATARQLAALQAARAQAGSGRARLVLVINRPRWGSGRRIEGHVVHALAGRVDPTEVVVVYTDQSGTTPPGRFPAGVREVDLAAIVRGLPRPLAVTVLADLIVGLHPDAVLNINSSVLYDALDAHGEALAATERVFPVMFCNEQLAQGDWIGWSLKHYYRVADKVPGIITDSQFLKDELTERNLLDDQHQDRIHVFAAPVQPDLPCAPAPIPVPGRRPRVYWAGRWDRQKRIDLVLSIARVVPEVDFRLWGERVLHGDHISDVPANLTLEGRYASFDDLDLGDADAWLYTSAWDGVPQLLLEVAMTGIPIVAGVVGGIGEILADGESWPIRDVDDPSAYAAAIRAVVADPQDARRRALLLRERLVAQRSEQAYGDRAAALLLRDGTP